MNKAELIKEIATETGLTSSGAEKFINSFISVVQDTLKKEENINIPGFGAFVVAERAERPGMDFKTKKKIIVAASKTVKFKPSDTLKKSVKASLI